MMKNRILPLLFLIFCTCSVSEAQSTLSPYTLFGVGEINSCNSGENSGMAGLGVGFSKENTINTANPASLSAIKAKSLVFDMAVSGKTALYEGQRRRELVGIGNLDRLTIAFRPGEHVAVSAGILPVSSVGYNFRVYSQTDGADEEIENIFSGEGGTNKAFVSLGISITRKLSFGMTGSVIWGNVTHTEESPYWIIRKKSASSGKPSADFGLQYSDKINDRLSFKVGAVAGLKTELSYRNTKTLSGVDSTLVNEKKLTSTKQNFPGFYGAGISLSSHRITVGADYVFQRWSSAESGSDVIRYKDMNKIVLGLSYVPNPHDVRKYMRNVTYQFGVSLNDSYMTVSNKSGWNFALTYGMVFPIIKSNTAYFGLEYGRNSFPVQNTHSIKENYIKISIGISFKEPFFIRHKYD